MGNSAGPVAGASLADLVQITSDHVLDDIEHHFRVTAGPGAGKTHWLVNHIRHVAQHSKRLRPTSRIGVISYTNIAVREILKRLDSVGDATDTSTIHSFLYRNVVRPYIHLLRDENGRELIAHALVDSHSDHHPSRKFLDEWLTECGRRQLLASGQKKNFDLLIRRLRALTVRVGSSKEAVFAPCKLEDRDAGIKALLTPERLLNYKKRYWANGTLDHEDVLYFAYRLLHEFPALRRFLSDRFPYLFIDEFQDTLPVQAALVRWLAAEGTVVGVVGDPEQAIYSFIDASALHFHEFCLDGHKTYAIAGNRRSTESIVKFLNRLRKDGLTQKAIRPESGKAPVVYFGDLTQALSHAQGSVTSPLLVLARRNGDVARARNGVQGKTNDPWEALEEGDAQRFRFLNHLAIAVDLAQRKLFDLAIQRLMQGISTRKGFREPIIYDGPFDTNVRRSVALSLVKNGLANHGQMTGQSALEFYNSTASHLPTVLPGLKLKGVMAGKTFHTVASGCKYSDLMGHLRTPDETRKMRTVHQAKGTEDDSVFVILSEEEAGYLLQPSSAPPSDEPRITYVGVSRARDQLFLYCPSPDLLSHFESLGLGTMTMGMPSSNETPKKKGRKSKSAAS